MGINYITRVEAFNVAASLSYDLPPISFQAGDFLIFGACFEGGAYTNIASVVDVGAGSFPFTLDGHNGNGTLNQLGMAHILSAPSSGSNVVFRATWASTITSVYDIFVEVWRPTAGVVMQLDVAKVSNTGNTATPTTGTISTSANSLVFALFVERSGLSKTVPLLGGLTPDTNPPFPAPTSKGVRFALSFASPQVGISGQYTLPSSIVFCSHIIAFKEVVTTVNRTITCTGITLGGAAQASQEVFVGGIG